MKIAIVSPELYPYGLMVLGGVLVDGGFDARNSGNWYGDTNHCLYE